MMCCMHVVLCCVSELSILIAEIIISRITNSLDVKEFMNSLKSKELGTPENSVLCLLTDASARVRLHLMLCVWCVSASYMVVVRCCLGVYV